jgi:mRNA interferase MazF
MGAFTVGDVVLIPFPYADFSKFKKRPAVVVGNAEFNNLILCQITSKAETSKRAVILTDSGFIKGSLQRTSFVRPDKLFTVEPSVIVNTIGRLQNDKTASIRTAIRQLFG